MNPVIHHGSNLGVVFIVGSIKVILGKTPSCFNKVGDNGLSYLLIRAGGRPPADLNLFRSAGCGAPADLHLFRSAGSLYLNKLYVL